MPVREKKEGRLDYKTSSKEILMKLLGNFISNTSMNLRVLLPCSILDWEQPGKQGLCANLVKISEHSSWSPPQLQSHVRGTFHGHQTHTLPSYSTAACLGPRGRERAVDKSSITLWQLSSAVEHWKGQRFSLYLWLLVDLVYPWNQQCNVLPLKCHGAWQKQKYWSRLPCSLY